MTSMVEIDRQISAFVNSHRELSKGRIWVDGLQVTALDTAGALLALTLVREAEPTFSGFRDSQAAILELTRSRYDPSNGLTQLVPSRDSFLEMLGRKGERALAHSHGLLSFAGQCVVGTLIIVRNILAGRWKRVRFKEFVVQLDQVFVTAIPIVALVSALIGVVVSYLFATQSMRYGGQIFLVDAIGIAMCRELSPIVVAIIVAGRSGSAFTAQLGTMKINEEIDAISTLGLSPLQVLVLPRMIALMLTIPLLVFIGNVAGIAGGVLIGATYVDITPATFLDRLQRVLLQKHIYIGFFKAPVFAMAIATIGCYMGLTTQNNARSVGLSTTSTVVQSIVSVIILNAIFAVIFVQMKL